MENYILKSEISIYPLILTVGKTRIVKMFFKEVNGLAVRTAFQSFDVVYRTAGTICFTACRYV